MRRNLAGTSGHPTSIARSKDDPSHPIPMPVELREGRDGVAFGNIMRIAQFHRWSASHIAMLILLILILFFSNSLNLPLFSCSSSALVLPHSPFNYYLTDLHAGSCFQKACARRSMTQTC